MGRKRVPTAGHKHVNTWHWRRNGTNRNRRHSGIHTTTLTISYVWWLECTSRHVVTNDRRQLHIQRERRQDSLLESTMGGWNVRTKELVHSKRNLTGPTSQVHVRKRRKKIVHRPPTRIRPCITCIIRPKHVRGYIRSCYDLDKYVTAGI